MLTEQQWNALDDDAPERQYANYLDYKDAMTKETNATPANAVSKQPLKLTDKEQKAATREGISVNNPMGNTTVVGPNTGRKFDPSKYHEVIDPVTGAWALAPVGIGGTDEPSLDGTSVGLGSAEEIAVEANKGTEWAEANEKAAKSMGHGTPVITDTNGKTVPTLPPEEGKKSTPSTGVQAAVNNSKSGGNGMSDRGYLVLNAIQTALQNAGLSAMNIASVMTGGKASNDYAQSEFEKRMSQKAQAGTEEQIAAENPMSRLGQQLKSAGLDIQTKQGRLGLANRVKAAMFNPDGTSKWPEGSPEFDRMATLYNQLSSGGGQVYSILDSLSTLGNRLLSGILY